MTIPISAPPGNLMLVDSINVADGDSGSLYSLTPGDVLIDADFLACGTFAMPSKL